jgi:hypothetical protein
MLQVMDNMVGGCVFYVKVGTITQLKQSKISFLTANKSGIVRLTEQHDWIVNVSFMNYPGDSLTQRQAYIPFLEECPTNISES